MTTQQERLRAVAVSIRTKPTPLSDFIPLLNQTADHIDKLEAEVERLRKDAERKPMTDEQMAEIGDRTQPYEWSSFFGRAIEAFHGIKGTP